MGRQGFRPNAKADTAVMVLSSHQRMDQSSISFRSGHHVCSAQPALVVSFAMSGRSHVHWLLDLLLQGPSSSGTGLLRLDGGDTPGTSL